MGGRMSRVEVSDEELAQRLLEGAQTALRALLAGDEAQIRAAEAALRDAEGALHAGLRDLGMQPDQATSSLPVGAQELLGQSQHKSQGLWGVGRAQLAMAMSAALSAAAAAARMAGDRGGGSGVRLSASTRRRLSEVADRLKALHPAD